MDQGVGVVSERSRALVGREAELARIAEFFGGRDLGGLALVGDPGIGKTMLWEAGLELARDAGFQVLSARASEGEARLSFSSLIDLVEGVEQADLRVLPTLQRTALEIALRRAEPEGAPPDPLAVAAGFRGALEAMAERAPVVVAIDDLQWLDRSSSDVVLFAAHRIPRERVRYLLARRSDSEAPLEGVLRTPGIETLRISGLSVGALGRLLAERLSLAISRRLLLQIHEGSQGNPLVALELGRLLADERLPVVGGRLVFPEIPRDLFTARIRALSPATRRVLLATALSGGLGATHYATFIDPLDLDDAITAGAVVADGSEVTASHPMLASAVRRDATAAERRALHAELAAAAMDPIQRAEHLSMGIETPDPCAASVAADAVELATDRGRVWDAVALARHALRLTPMDDPCRGARLIRLARAHDATGDLKAMTDVLRVAIAELEPGPDRVVAHLLLCNGWNLDLAEAGRHIQQALDEAGSDVGLQAWARARHAVLLMSYLTRIDEAHAWSREALASASSTAPYVQYEIGATVAWAALLRGLPLESRDDGGSAVSILDSVDRVDGVRLAFRGHIDEARTRFRELASASEARGELHSIAGIRIQQTELELRAGNVIGATEVLHECEAALLDAQVADAGNRAYVARLKAVRAALSGRPEEAQEWARLVRGPDVNPESPMWDRLEVARALGIAAAFERDPARAIDHLGFVWEHTTREHIDDPGAFPVAGDLIEALVIVGRLDDARRVLDRLEGLAEVQDHPWGLATVRRAYGLLDLGTGSGVDAAYPSLRSAADAFAELGLNFDRARVLLALGVAQRRERRRSAARASLAEAAEVFSAGGATGWAARASEELDRVSGRRAGAGHELTPTELKVASLAADGLTNAEIAAQLFVSVNTVEGHLSHAYAKLGIRSRAHLRSRLS